MRVFAVCLWHSEGWTSRKEGLMEAVCKAGVNHQMSQVSGLRCQHGPRRFQGQFVVQRKVHVH